MFVQFSFLDIFFGQLLIVQEETEILNRGDNLLPFSVRDLNEAANYDKKKGWRLSKITAELAITGVLNYTDSLPLTFKKIDVNFRCLRFAFLYCSCTIEKTNQNKKLSQWIIG